MPRRKFEKPQRGNPHQLPFNQQIWPLKSIGRFVDGTGTGTVCLFDKVRNRMRQAKSDDDAFCAKRVWDRRAEFGYMKGIEDAFQELAAEIVAGTVTTIAAAQKGKVDAFFALWEMRADYKTSDGGEVNFKGVTGANWSIDQEEKFEKGHAAFLRKGGNMPARMVIGLRIQIEIDAYVHDALSGIQWGIIGSEEGHFIVPDYPANPIIPLTPTLCLCSGGQSGTIKRQDVAGVNSCLKLDSREYFFARDFAQCP
jgi:hypothetical protein